MPKTAKQVRLGPLAGLLFSTALVAAFILPSAKAQDLYTGSGTERYFPIRSDAYSYGSWGSSFGAGRPGGPHQGQDISAACGTPLVAALGGTVVANNYHHRAGWHLVVADQAENISLAYIHLQGRSRLMPGQKVIPGKFIGQVGQTGRAFSCHLHFELWRGPWQRSPGYPVDPLNFLRSLPVVTSAKSLNYPIRHSREGDNLSASRLASSPCCCN